MNWMSWAAIAVSIVAIGLSVATWWIDRGTMQILARLNADDEGDLG